METVHFPLGSKITVDGDCSHEIKKLLLLIKKAMTNLDSVLKSRDTTLMVESEKELKRLLMRVQQESERAGLKLDIKKSKIMASGPLLHGK